MSTLSKTYTFTTGTTIVASEVNTNFDDVVSYVNTNAIVKDGSKAMTAALTLDGAEPSGSNVAVRRKSAYRECLGSHPAGNVFTVGGLNSASFVSLGEVSDPFSYTPDYTYDMLVHLTGEIFFSTNGALAELGIHSPDGTSINAIGPGSGNTNAYMAGNNSSYEAVNMYALRQNIAGGTVPYYKLYYRLTSGGGTLAVYLFGLVSIFPSTRQLPN